MAKTVTNVKKSKEVESNDDDDKIDEFYRPFLIHSTTCVILGEQILSLMPSERNVLLTMNEYSLTELNPMHPDTEDSPTHVIIFCIRFVGDDIFQPIGGLLIYKYEDQSVLLAECLKAFIHDLWILGLYVVATVSPPFETFKGMLKRLVDIQDFNTYSGVLCYSVAPFNELIHIYDIQFLLIKLQNLLKEGDIKFVEGTREYRASWEDISLVLNLCSEFKILSNYLRDNKDVSRRVHIFTQQIFEQFLELEAQDVLSENAEGSAVLLNCVRTFLQFTELDLVNLNLMSQVDCWDSLTHILQTMIFQKSKKRTCTKVKPTRIHTITKPSTKRRIDFQMESNLEIDFLLQNSCEPLVIGEETLHNCDVVDAKDNYVAEIIKQDEQKENNSNSNNTAENGSQNCKQKKGKRKKNIPESVRRDNSLDQNSIVNDLLTVKQQHLKKPYEKHTNTKLSELPQPNSGDTENNVSTQNKLKKNIKNEEKSSDDFMDSKPSRTDNFLDIENRKNIDESDFASIVNLSCDKNNNDSKTVQNKSNKKQNTTVQKTCDNKIKTKRERKLKKKIKEENFDIVINDAQKFFQSFSDYNSLNIDSISNIPTSINKDLFSNVSQGNIDNGIKDEKPYFSDVQENYDASTIKNVNESEYKLLSSYDGQKSENFNNFCSKSDEETEKCITKSCDKVPNIIDLLDNGSNKEVLDDFEQNNVTFEMLSTVFGMKKVIGNLVKRRVRIAKPDAFVVEHIDLLVTLIKRDKNNISPVHYYGHNYDLLNTELAFATLHNKNGLYLVSK